MKSLLSILIILITSTSYAQETGCSFEYRHYTGLVGSDTAIMDLMVLNGDIKGTIVYPQRFYSLEDQEFMYTERLEGELDRYNVASLEAYPAQGETGEYSGTFETTFQGTYRASRANKGSAFSMREKYDGSIQFSGYCINRDTVLLDTIDAPRAELKLALLLPAGDSTEYIRDEILKVYIHDENMLDNPDNEILSVYCKQYFVKYIESNIDIYDGGHAFNWEMSGITTISINRLGLLVYRADNYAYTGGAHGIGVSRFLVFDTERKSKLELSDLFQENAMENLGKMLENRYREMYYLDDDEPLSEAGLFDDRITPSPNFWITGSSISFYYNPYELAPYSMGSITITLPYTALRDLLKEDSPVMRLGW